MDPRLEGTKLGELFTALNSSVEDYLKAHEGNKMASTRVRAAMSAVKDLAHELRKEMLATRKKD